MIQQEKNVAMSVNTISNGISTILIVPHHWCTIVVPHVGNTTIFNTWSIDNIWQHFISTVHFIINMLAAYSNFVRCLKHKSFAEGKCEWRETLFCKKWGLTTKRHQSVGQWRGLASRMYAKLETVYTSTYLSLNVPFKVKRITCTTKSSSFLSIF